MRSEHVEIDNMMPIQEASFVHKYKTDRSVAEPSTHNANVPFNFGFLLIFHISFTHRVCRTVIHQFACIDPTFSAFSDFCSSNALVVCDSHLIVEYQSSSTRYQTFFGSASLRRSMRELCEHSRSMKSMLFHT